MVQVPRRESGRRMVRIMAGSLSWLGPVWFGSKHEKWNENDRIGEEDKAY